MSKTFCIQISGRVQGVGFRPFVYNLAEEFYFKGNVLNNEKGVIIHINTCEKKAHLFLKAIIKNKPESSIITSTDIKEISYKHFKDFRIITSSLSSKINTPLTPDFAICPSCRTEIRDMKNRRFGYAFTTCVNCGPRYSLTTLFPFEREHTSLAEFDMCLHCHNEYTNPKNKRFHSQTNSCHNCGITMELADHHGKTISSNQSEIIGKVSNLIRSGHILAIKNTNGYLLCCDAKNTKAITELRRRKHRPNKPFAVLYPDLKSVQNDFHVSRIEEEELTSRIAPIVILQNRKEVRIDKEHIAPYLDKTGVMLPNSALFCLLMDELQRPIIATSGNIHGNPIIYNQKEAEEKLNKVADYFLHHDLNISFSQDDSVVKFVDNKKIILRRSRGLAPNVLNQRNSHPEPVLAMGADLKSAFNFSTGLQTYVSQYLGNLSNYEVLNRFKNTLQEYQNIFSTTPERLLIDGHLQYQSSQFGLELAEEYRIPIETIQHHKAHFASVLGEHHLFEADTKVLGVIWDGTGLGEDNQIWGGEFFVYENYAMKRVSHFEYFNWLANDKMAKEPRLSLLSLLNEKQRQNISDKFSATEWKVYTKNLEYNTLKTSSVGRLFDAIASGLNLCDQNTYEGEAAMILEQVAFQYKDDQPIDFLKDLEYELIPTDYIISELIQRFQNGEDLKRLAFSFIYTLARSITRMAKKLDISIVACSGGVFQNSLLIRLLEKEPIQLKLNQELSPNDENISFGQLQYYQYIKSKQHVFSNTRENKEHPITA